MTATVFDVLVRKARAKPHHASTKREGLYIARMLENVEEWTAWAKAAGLPPLDDNLHVTQLFSSVGVQLPLAQAHIIIEPDAITGIGHLGKDDALVVFFDDKTMTARFNEAIAAGAVTTYDSFRPHLTLCYDPGKTIDPTTITLPDLPLELGPEYAGPVADDVFTAARKDRANRSSLFDWLCHPRLTGKEIDPWASVPPHIADALQQLANGFVEKCKATDWQQIIVGYSSVEKTGDGRIVVDADGEVMDLEAIKETLARGDFDDALFYRHGFKDSRKRIGTVLEHFVLDEAAKEALGLPAHVATGYLIAAHVEDEMTWKEVLDGTITMLSIGAKVIQETMSAAGLRLFDWLAAGGVG
jgi:hypothetical protein